jgi:hypothetical protein
MDKRGTDEEKKVEKRGRTDEGTERREKKKVKA